MGTISTSQVTEAGLHRGILQEYVKSGEMYRFGRGCMCWAMCGRTIFTFCSVSMDAESIPMILHCTCWVIRTVPRRNIRWPFRKATMRRLWSKKTWSSNAFVPENYEFGQIQIKSLSGNPIRVYDLERTLCDILRGSGSDIQIVSEAMKRYAASKDKNIHKLMKYADQLRVKPKVLRYMEVLLSGKAIPFESCGKNTDANMTTQRIFPLKITAILFRKLWSDHVVSNCKA